MHNEPSAADPRISVVRVTVRFKDDQRVEFSEELANLYQPEPGSPEARRLAEVRGISFDALAEEWDRLAEPSEDGVCVGGDEDLSAVRGLVDV